MQPERRRDLLAGLICMMAGMGVVLEASRYGIGSLGQLGSGFYPAGLGGLLALIGALITAGAFSKTAGEDDVDPLLDGAADLRGPDWRGWSCIIAGVVLFIVCAWATGLASAIFACVFVSALGDRSGSWKGSLILALVMTTFGTVLFGYFLRINMPLWQWPLSP
jgi:hypothetical protein